jgi:hypothetical protein
VGAEAAAFAPASGVVCAQVNGCGSGALPTQSHTIFLAPPGAPRRRPSGRAQAWGDAAGRPDARRRRRVVMKPHRGSRRHSSHQMRDALTLRSIFLCGRRENSQGIMNHFSNATRRASATSQMGSAVSSCSTPSAAFFSSCRAGALRRAKLQDLEERDRERNSESCGGERGVVG